MKSYEHKSQIEHMPVWMNSSLTIYGDIVHFLVPEFSPRNQLFFLVTSGPIPEIECHGDEHQPSTTLW